jgi:hypothetical protein
MKTITKGHKHEETIPLPVWHDDNGVLQYDSNWADELVCQCYGDDTDKYEIDPRSLELFYLVSPKMRFKIAEITYESYFTDIKGKEWEKEWLETWNNINEQNIEDELDSHDADEYEMYNLTLYHYNHPSLKSKLIKSSGELKGINGKEYFKGIIERLERKDDDDLYYS